MKVSMSMWFETVYEFSSRVWIMIHIFLKIECVCKTENLKIFDITICLKYIHLWQSLLKLYVKDPTR